MNSKHKIGDNEDTHGNEDIGARVTKRQTPKKKNIIVIQR